MADPGSKHRRAAEKAAKLAEAAAAFEEARLEKLAREEAEKRAAALAAELGAEGAGAVEVCKMEGEFAA